MYPANRKNYGLGLERERRRQLIPIKESATKEVPRLETIKRRNYTGKIT